LLLLEKGADVNAKNEYCTTPLHRACSGRHENIVSLLLEKGADVSMSKATLDIRHFTLLPQFKGCQAAVSLLLLEKGAEVNAQNGFGETPLFIVLANIKDTKISFHCCCWSENGADVNAQDNNGKTPLFVHACTEGCKATRIVSLLVEKGTSQCQCQRQRRKNPTVVGQQESLTCEDIVSFSLEKGANINETIGK
jgi:ankyrin repeat protein